MIYNYLLNIYIHQYVILDIVYKIHINLKMDNLSILNMSNQLDYKLMNNQNHLIQLNIIHLYLYFYLQYMLYTHLHIFYFWIHDFQERNNSEF